MLVSLLINYVLKVLISEDEYKEMKLKLKHKNAISADIAKLCNYGKKLD